MIYLLHRQSRFLIIMRFQVLLISLSVFVALVSSKDEQRNQNVSTWKVISANNINDFKIAEHDLFSIKDIKQWARVSYSSRNNTLTIKNLTDFTLFYLRNNTEPNKNVVFSTFHLRLLLTLLYEVVSEKAGIEISEKLILSNRHRTFVYMLDYVDVVSELKKTTSVFLSQVLFADHTTLLSHNFQFYLNNFSIPALGVPPELDGRYIVNLWSTVVSQQIMKTIFDYSPGVHHPQMVAASAVCYSLNLVNVFPSIILKTFKDVTRRIMTTVGIFNHTTLPSLQAEVLSIPTNIQKVALWIILPTKNQTVENVERGLKRDDLLGLKFTPSKIQANIPQFDIETHIGKASLKKIGLHAIFLKNDLNINEDGENGKITLDNVVQGVRLQVRSLITNYTEPAKDGNAQQFSAYQPFMFFLMYSNHRVQRVPLLVGKFYP